MSAYFFLASCCSFPPLSFSPPPPFPHLPPPPLPLHILILIPLAWCLVKNISIIVVVPYT